jgi:hypothetical protein
MQERVCHSLHCELECRHRVLFQSLKKKKRRKRKKKRAVNPKPICDTMKKQILWVVLQTNRNPWATEGLKDQP